MIKLNEIAEDLKIVAGDVVKEAADTVKKEPLTYLIRSRKGQKRF